MRNQHDRKSVFTVIVIALLWPAFSFCMGRANGNSGDYGRRTMSEIRAADKARDGYAVREIHYGAAWMREFMTPSGLIFALEWEGMTKPDVKALLGSYADARLAQMLGMPGRSPGSGIREEEIQMQEWGPPGEPHGRAFAPGLIPPRVRIDDLWSGQNPRKRR